MIVVEFEGVDQKSHYRKCTLGSPDFDSCVESINHLIDNGWLISEVRLLGKESSVGVARSRFKSPVLKDPADHLLEEVLILLNRN